MKSRLQVALVLSGVKLANQVTPRSIWSWIRDRRISIFGHVGTSSARIGSWAWSTSSGSQHPCRSATSADDRPDCQGRN